jgi:hypothetical protein
METLDKLSQTQQKNREFQISYLFVAAIDVDIDIR